VLTDTLPAEVSLVKSSPAANHTAGQVLTFQLGDIAAGASTKVTITVLVKVTSGSPANAAAATTDSVEGGDGSANNADTCSSNIVAADVAIEKTCPSSSVANTMAWFTVDFSNVGSAAAKDVVVVDDVPAGFFKDNAFTAASNVGTVQVNGLKVTVNVGTLAANASGQLTITGRVNPSSNARGDYVNQAAIATSSSQPNALNDTANCTTRLTAPVLVLAKTSKVCAVQVDLTNTAVISAGEIVEKPEASKTDSGVATGSVIIYTLTYSNSGDADATGVVVKDTLPAGVTYVSSSNGGSYVDGVVTWDIGTVAPGASGAVTVTVKISQ
jgi:uncharacterized repeat protein (TIGR01451 family)